MAIPQGQTKASSNETKRNKTYSLMAKEKQKSKAISKSKNSITGKDDQPQQKASDENPPRLSSTRVCIKNLPIKLAEEQLKAFIQDQLKKFSNNDNDVSHIRITDCRVLRKQKEGATSSSSNGKSRRVAFVGFNTPEGADFCVKKLNRAYCRTSQLAVDYAHLPQIKGAGSSAGGVSDQTHKSKQERTTNDGSQHKAKDAAMTKLERKKEEFLAAMGVATASSTLTSEGTTKGKFWSNDALVGNPETLVAEPDDDDATSQSSNSSSSSSEDDNSEDEDDADPLKKIPSGATTKFNPLSDIDFLRSKQVAVKDFDEPTESEDMEVEEEEEDKDDVDVEDTIRDCKANDHDKDGDNEDEIDKNEGNGDQSADEANIDSDEHDVDDLDEDTAGETFMKSRLFLRNLPFSATEADICEHFDSFGKIQECHIPVDDQKRNKGFAFVTFMNSADAHAAMVEKDGQDFQGRILHVLPAKAQPQQQDGDTAGQGRTYKDQLEKKRQENAIQETKGWSASFVRGDAVADTLAERLGLRKGELFDVKDGLSGGDAAVKMALGETAVIEENRKYFAEHGFDMEALVSLPKKDAGADFLTSEVKRSKTAILVKNLPHDTARDELLKVFQSVASASGEAPSQVLLPPSRTIAVVEYEHPNYAKRAFRKLAFRRFKSVPLYLEWAPLAAKTSTSESAQTKELGTEKEDDDEDNEEKISIGATATLYIKNINFGTDEDGLLQAFAKYKPRTVRIPRKVAPLKRAGHGSEQIPRTQNLSMGYAFIEFGSQETAKEALRAMHGAVVDGHVLEVKPSSNKIPSTSVISNQAKKEQSKLMVRNVPFQANRKELLQLFGSFGQLKKLRLPRKFDGNHRGFCFVEYLSSKEALAAMQSLSRTHLYGRHLVIEWASADESDNVDLLRQKAERDVSTATQPKNKKIRFE